MTVLNEVYRCSVCGNIVEVLHAGVGTLVCCGKPMEKQEEKSVDVGKEKHVPVIERMGGKVVVKLGSVPHPMEEKHYIEWIELEGDGIIQRKHPSPGQKPEAEFSSNAAALKARAYCNIHGHWKSG